jgi:hypothetical protein
MPLLSIILSKFYILVLKILSPEFTQTQVKKIFRFNLRCDILFRERKRTRARARLPHLAHSHKHRAKTVSGSGSGSFTFTND